MEGFDKKIFMFHRDVFSMGAIGALAPTILKNRLYTQFFKHFSTVG